MVSWKTNMKENHMVSVIISGLTYKLSGNKELAKGHKQYIYGKASPSVQQEISANLWSEEDDMLVTV
jgi:hypothetical protein